MTPRNVRKKPWYNEAIGLDKLIQDLITIRDGLGGKPCRVVGVLNPTQPQEAEIVGIVARSRLLEQQLVSHLNALATEATDLEIDESALDNEYELSRDGEVVYVVLGPVVCESSKLVYEV